MTQHHTLSLTAAILININIMLGVGIFINTALLAQGAGALGFLSYALVALLLLPLIICVAELVKLHPSGGFYIFARRELNPFCGFLSAWIYFTGKLASSAIMIHTAVLIIQSILPTLASINPIAVDMVVLTLFIGLNMLNMRAGSRIQAAFTTLKATTIFFAIFVGLYLFDKNNFSASHRIWHGIPATLPLVLYAAMGFEAACALSSRIRNAQRNAPRAIFISYGIVVSIIMLYQFAFYGALGTQLAQIATYRDAFPHLLMTLNPTDTPAALSVGSLFTLAIAASALGGAYGILFSNTWNLYALAQHQHLFFAPYFARFNKHAIPTACVVAEGILCALYLLISQGNQVPLQQTSALAAALTYTLSVIALVAAQRKQLTPTLHRWIPLLGLLNCAILISACVRGLLMVGIGSLSLFITALVVGIGMFFVTPGRTLAEPTEASK